MLIISKYKYIIKIKFTIICYNSYKLNRIEVAIMDKNEVYRITLKNDKTLKQMVDRYYIIPREPIGYSFTEDEKAFLQSKALFPSATEVKEGKNGYIVFRGKKPKKLTEQQIQEIQENNLSQRQLAKIYKVSPATINRVKNNKY